MASLLAGCGGGGSGTDAAQTTSQSPSTPQLPTLSVTLSTSSVDTAQRPNTSEQLIFDAFVTGKSDKAVVPVVKFDTTVLTQKDAITQSPAGQYIVTLATVPSLAFGKHTGQITFQLCTDAACSAVYPGSQKTLDYTVMAKTDDWKTFQRDAGHTGYVPATLDPAKFTKLWAWQRPAGDSEPIGGINSVATTDSKVIVTKDVYAGQGALYFLNEGDGAETWHYDLGQLSSEGAPAYDDGVIYVPLMTMNESGGVWAINANGGTLKSKSTFSAQWSNFFAPTVQGGKVLFTSGLTYAYSTTDGSTQWSAYANSFDMTTPATDGQYVYQYGSDALSGLSIFSLASGQQVARIVDPLAPQHTSYSEFAAPMISAPNHVVAFSGAGFSGRAASSSETYDSRPLVCYDVQNHTVAWKSASTYLAHPATAKGVIYAGSGQAARIDALSDTDGHVLWSWTAPAGSAMHRNLVVTDNLLFASTTESVYAIDLTTHKTVWTYPRPGNLAISGNGTLYIATGATLSDGGLVAIKLI